MSIQLIITGIDDGIIFESSAFIPTDFSYYYRTPATSQAKSTYQQAFLAIRGHIHPDIADPNPVLPLWANTIWTPSNSLTEYYRDVQVIEIRAGQLLRLIRFPKASVFSYYEKAASEDSLIQFSLLLHQKIDCLQEIEIDRNIGTTN